MARNVRTYDHFCLVARTLERIGDRWSLLVIRDLLTGPKRFTDLMDRLGGITPKTLTLRLRELGDAGIVDADRVPGRREVRYRLTPAGAELGPIVDGLAWWGIRHAWRAPSPGEPLHVEHLLNAVTLAIAHTGDTEPATWHVHFHDGDDYVLASGGEHWSLTMSSHMSPPHAPPDVRITASTHDWVQFAIDPTPDRAAELHVDIDGEAGAVRRCYRLLRAFRDTLDNQTSRYQADHK
jgi:DNA-binding HxlR family transcriptional regulator